MKARFGLCRGNQITIVEGPHRLKYRGGIEEGLVAKTLPESRKGMTITVVRCLGSCECKGPAETGTRS